MRVEGHRIPATSWLDRQLALGLAPRAASLAYAVGFVFVWYGILLILHRKRVFCRV